MVEACMGKVQQRERKLEMTDVLPERWRRAGWRVRVLALCYNNSHVS